MSQRTYWTNFFFFFLNSLCITVYNSHLGCKREAETVYRSSLSETKKCNCNEVGPRVTKWQADLPEGSPWVGRPPIQAKETEPDHESIFVWMQASLLPRAACKNTGFLVGAFPSSLPPSTNMLLDQLYEVRQDKYFSVNLLVSWRKRAAILSLKWRIYSFLPVV